MLGGVPRPEPPFPIPDRELRWRFSRAGGPGGQGVNTADSRVELSVDLASVLPDDALARARRRLGARMTGTVLTVVASEHRTQLANRKAARERLDALLAGALEPEPPPRRPTRPSAGARARRRAAKQRRSAVKRLRGRPEE
jgi:ribosome-associated protein